MNEVVTTSWAGRIQESLSENGIPVRSEPALNKFLETGLPGPKSEEYKYTPVQRIIKKAWDNPVVGAESDLRPDYPFDLDSIKVVFVNGKIDEEQSDLNTDEIDIDRFTTPEEENIEHIAFDDPFYLINKAMFTDGIKVRIGKGLEINRPLEIFHLSDSTQKSSLTLPMIMIELEDQASLKVIEHFQYKGENQSFLFPVNRYKLGKNAKLETYTFQSGGRQQIQVSNTIIDQLRDSNYINYTYSLEGYLIRNNHSAIQLDENCETNLFGLTLLKEKDHIDHHTIVDHLKPNSYSNELYKGIYDDKSTGVFNGRIFVRQDAQKTNAFQSNNNILLTDRATLHTKPQLEIWADDVKCSHGCTSGQLDEEAMFYLQTRGIIKEQARVLLLKAFAGEVIDSVKILEIKDYISNLIDRRL